MPVNALRHAPSDGEITALSGGEGGVGLFSAFVADIADLVTLVDSYPPAVTDAETSLDVCDNADLIEGPVEDVLPELEETYDATILDPPASGLSVTRLMNWPNCASRRVWSVSAATRPPCACLNMAQSSPLTSPSDLLPGLGGYPGSVSRISGKP